MMLLLIVLLLGITIWGVRLVKADGMSMAQTTCIRGFFALVILLSHLRQYVTLSTPGDMLYCTILGYLGQLMVAPFLFYSGYGILYGLDRKEHYTKGFFVARIGKTWFKFALAVLLFCITNLCLGIFYSPKTVALSFTGWTAVGNSNWFVFDILILYLGVQVSIWLVSPFHKQWTKTKELLAYAILLTLWTGLFVLFLRYTKENWWYNTLLCFPGGAVFYLIKPKLDFLWRKNWGYWGSGCILLITFLLSHHFGWYLPIYYICGVVFCLLIVWLNSRIKVGNKLLRWTGKYSFYIYIYMRIPMIVLSHLGLNQYPFPFAAASILLTMLLAFGMGTATEFLAKKLFTK